MLIGEYATDLLEGKDIVICKKPDTVMRYLGTGRDTDLYLAPKDFLGMVTLVNSATFSKANCYVTTVFLAGSLRVLLITLTTIRRGSQLTYYYGPDYKFCKKNKSGLN